MAKSNKGVFGKELGVIELENVNSFLDVFVSYFFSFTHL